MNSLEKTIDELIGKSVAKFYRRIDPERTMLHEDGLGELVWYKLIFETPNGIKYLLEENSLEKIEKTKNLMEIKPDFQELAIGKTIRNVIRERQFGGLYVELENGILIYHETFFGSELTIKKMKKVFDESGDLK